jgi:hypothetical protein
LRPIRALYSAWINVLGKKICVVLRTWVLSNSNLKPSLHVSQQWGLHEQSRSQTSSSKYSGCRKCSKLDTGPIAWSKQGKSQLPKVYTQWRRFEN